MARRIQHKTNDEMDADYVPDLPPVTLTKRKSFQLKASSNKSSFAVDDADDVDQVDDDVSVEADNESNSKKRKKYASKVPNLYADDYDFIQLAAEWRNVAGGSCIADVKFDLALDINSPSCTLRNDATWLAAQLAEGKAEYTSLKWEERRAIVFAYFSRDDPLSDVTQRKARTNRFFVQQRGWPSSAVVGYIKRYLGGTSNAPRRSLNRHDCSWKHDRADLVEKYRQRKESENITIRQFAIENGIHSSTMNKIVNMSSAMGREQQQWRADVELKLEVNRCVVLAKFLESPGGYRERRSECCRYFGKTPGFTQPFIVSTLNKFIRRGTIWSTTKFATINLNAKELQCPGIKVMDLTPHEEQFLQTLSEKQVELSATLCKKSANEHVDEKLHLKHVVVQLRSELEDAHRKNEQLQQQLQYYTTGNAVSAMPPPLHPMQMQQFL